MDIVLAPFYLVYKLWIGLVFWLTLLLLYPAFYYLLQKEERFPKAFRLKKFWSRLIRTLIFCPIKKEFRADLPKPPYIIASNHSSHLDTVFMYSIFTDYFLFIGKGELLKWPLFGLFFRKMDIPVHRQNSKLAYKALQKAYEALGKGENVALYPEGTIPDSAPRMKAFKNGAFKMAVDNNVPIVPITWQSCYKVISNPEKLFSPSRPAVVRAVIHPPVYPKGNTDADIKAMRDEVFQLINSALPPDYQR
ncbi:MAG TPA: lysophospholipid acyltransferase family protein [Flavobacteriales bacterium]